MSKLLTIQNIQLNQVSFAPPLTAIGALMSLFAMTAFLYHNKADVHSKYSLFSISLLGYLKKFVATFGTQSIKSQQYAASQPKTCTTGFSMISAWFLTNDSRNVDEETQKIAKLTHKLSFTSLPTTFNSKKFTKNAQRAETGFENDIVARKSDSFYENRSKKRVMPSFTILTKKLREIKRNIRENCGELDFSDVQAMSPVKKVNG
jgi:hypothetical protein